MSLLFLWLPLSTYMEELIRAAVTLWWTHIVYSLNLVHLWTCGLLFFFETWITSLNVMLHVFHIFWISWCCKYSTFRWVSFLVCIAVDPWINRFIGWIYCLLLISTFHWGTNMTNVYLKNQSCRFHFQMLLLWSKLDHSCQCPDRIAFLFVIWTWSCHYGMSTQINESGWNC